MRKVSGAAIVLLLPGGGSFAAQDTTAQIVTSLFAQTKALYTILTFKCSNET
ncbi:MAG TPA: hypothetical protein VGG81_00435 [Edaphobacter sp.]